jgi:hypothetical protein
MFFIPNCHDVICRCSYTWRNAHNDKYFRIFFPKVPSCGLKNYKRATQVQTIFWANSCKGYIYFDLLMNILESLDDNPFITNFTSSFCYIGMWDWLYFLHVLLCAFFLNFFFPCIVFSCLFAIIFGGELFNNHICLWQEQPPLNFGDVSCLVTQMMKPMCGLDS